MSERCCKFTRLFFCVLRDDIKEWSWMWLCFLFFFIFGTPTVVPYAMYRLNNPAIYLVGGLVLLAYVCAVSFYTGDVCNKAEYKMRGWPILDSQSHSILYRLLRTRLGLTSWTGAIKFLVFPHHYCDDQNLAVIYSALERKSEKHHKLQKANESLRRSVQLRENDEAVRSISRVDSNIDETSFIEIEEDDNDEDALLPQVTHRSRHPSSTSEEPSSSSTVVTTAEVYKSNSDESD